ncbi:PDZ and LIM domain protein 2 [Labeo rohita]|uniref:PDZ and LIM domain protein 2 n=1 Tax=Labeo rohita TaxID=84645 RepID=A0ABQ8MBK0_LABRO|nr:PDZ and LIM domain protein 2 [Labeo rohita]
MGFSYLWRKRLQDDPDSLKGSCEDLQCVLTDLQKQTSYSASVTLIQDFLLIWNTQSSQNKPMSQYRACPRGQCTKTILRRLQTTSHMFHIVHVFSSSQSFRAPLERNYSPEQLKQHGKVSTTGHNSSASDCIQTAVYESQTTKKNISFNYPVWSYGPVDPEELMRIKRRQLQPQEPRQSNTFRVLQEGLERMSLPSGAVQRSQRFRTCERCGYIIVTQVVKIRERRYRHVECYTCRDCGFSLMEQGHFWVDEELYCEKHAQERCQTASGLHLPQAQSKHW